MPYPWAPGWAGNHLGVFAYNVLASGPDKEKGSYDLSRNSLFFLARLERFELPTYGFVVRRSIQLSYRRKFKDSLPQIPSHFKAFLHAASHASLFVRNGAQQGEN